MAKIKYILGFILICFSFMAQAWQIVPNESHINFTATQNGSPVTGSFKVFSGDIKADPEHLDITDVKIIVDMNSVSTSYSEIADTLKTADWFNVKVFPQAVFTTKNIKKLNNNHYESQGLLTIRDKTVPVVLDFNLDNYTKTNAKITGSTMLKRTAFGIGQGDWAKTDAVKDDVKINFVLSVIQK